MMIQNKLLSCLLILTVTVNLSTNLSSCTDRLKSVLSEFSYVHKLVKNFVSVQYPSGKVLDRWLMVTPEEELLILKQFLRFGETRPIVELMTLHLSDPEMNHITKKCQSNISTFIERSGRMPGILRNARRESRLVAGVCHFKKNNPAIHHFENFPGGLSLLLPFHFPSSAYHCFAPPTKVITL